MKDTMKEFIEDETNAEKQDNTSDKEVTKEEPIAGAPEDTGIDINKLSTQELLHLYKEKFPEDYEAFLDKIHKQFENLN